MPDRFLCRRCPKPKSTSCTVCRGTGKRSGRKTNATLLFHFAYHHMQFATKSISERLKRSLSVVSRSACRDGPLCPVSGSWHDPRNVSYSDEGCQPTFFNVIPDRSNVDQRPKFTARISRTTPFAFSSREVLARLTNAASESAPLYVPRISATLRKLDAVPIKSIVEAQILPILVPLTPSPYF